MHRAGLVGNHIVSRRRIETVDAETQAFDCFIICLFSYFFPTVREETGNAAQQGGVDPAFTLALLQHLRLDREAKSPWLRGSLVFQIAGAQDHLQKEKTRLNRSGTGHIMDELIERLVSKAGIDSAVAEKTIGIVLDFLRNEGPSDKVQALIDQIPGAEAAIAASASNGGFSRLMGGGLMAVGTRLMAFGLGMSEIQGVARELFKFGRNKIGADQMGEIISETPGLSQFA
jgi:hypothetical protein